MRIGIDVDGVLANQVAAVLPRIEAKYGLRLSYGQLDQWRYPLGDSDIGIEIMEAMEDSDWIRSMPVHPGCAEALDGLKTLGEVVIVTARPAESAEATLEWLESNRLPFHRIVHCLGTEKVQQNLDILVDDYTGNIEGFLACGSGMGVLLDQPWNQEGRDALARLGAPDRFRVVRHLSQVVRIVRAIMG